MFFVPLYVQYGASRPHFFRSLARIFRAITVRATESIPRQVVVTLRNTDTYIAGGGRHRYHIKLTVCTNTMRRMQMPNSTDERVWNLDGRGGIVLCLPHASSCASPAYPSRFITSICFLLQHSCSPVIASVSFFRKQRVANADNDLLQCASATSL
jgi:hypothetical protein